MCLVSTTTGVITLYTTRIFVIWHLFIVFNFFLLGGERGYHGVPPSNLSQQQARQFSNVLLENYQKNMVYVVIYVAKNAVENQTFCSN